MKKTSKENPITFFRKANKARESVVKKSMPKAQLGMSVGPTSNWTKPYPEFKHSDRITKGYETPFEGPLNESESISVSKGMMSPAMQNYMKSPNQSKNSEEVNQKKKGGVPKAQLGAIIKMTKTVAKAPKYITTAQRDLKAAKFVKKLDDARGGTKAVENAVKAKEKADKAITLSKIAQAPGGKTVIGGGIAGSILALNKVGSNKSSSKSKGTKAATGAMSKAFPLKKEQLGGSFEKRAERKITKSIKKSVKNSGKKI